MNHEFFERPIPLDVDDPEDVTYRAYPLDLNTSESDEPIIDALAEGLEGESIYARTDGHNAPYFRAIEGALDSIRLRKGLVEKLKLANERTFHPLGLELYLLDGYRTYACQHAIYDFFVEVARKKLGKETPLENIHREIRQYIGIPRPVVLDDPMTWFSHGTGAAVDLTVRRRDNREHLHMGGVFDDPSEVSHTDYFERTENPTYSVSFEAAKRHRRLLFWGMHDVGFSNLASEWWHYDYKDQLWAKSIQWTNPERDKEVAVYGFVPPEKALS